MFSQMLPTGVPTVNHWTSRSQIKEGREMKKVPLSPTMLAVISQLPNQIATRAARSPQIRSLVFRALARTRFIRSCSVS